MAKAERMPAFHSDGVWTPPHGRSGRGLLGLLAFLLIVGGLGWFHARFSSRPIWTVRSIEVQGNRSISTSALLDQLGVEPGMPWWRVSGRLVAPLMADHPRIRSCRLAWHWPRDLRIAVEEQESVLRLLNPRALELAADGTLLAPHEALDPLDLPLLTGALPADLAPGKKCEFPEVGQSWRELLAIGVEDPALWKAISEIRYLGNQEFQIFLRDGHKVIFWSAGVNPELKRQIPTILAELGQRGVKDAVLDLRFKDQAVVRLPESAGTDTIPRPPGGKNARRRA